MADMNRSTVVGVFEHRGNAEQAVDQLRHIGFTNEQIGVVAPDVKNADGTTTHGTGTSMMEKAGIGAAAGAGVGGLVGLGILAGVIPVLGPIIAGGSLAVILANAAGGAAIAGLVGALVGLGIPEDEAAHYEGEFKSGRTLVTVKDVGARHNEVLSIIRKFGGYNKQNPPEASVTPAMGTSASARTTASTARAGVAGGDKVVLHEEEMHANKQKVKTGEVRVHKEVITENKVLNVPVEREEVVIERHAASGKGGADSFRTGQEIRIPVSEEVVKVSKENVVKEEVSVGKRKVQSNEQVTGTVRKEEVRVEHEGDVVVHDKDKAKLKSK